MNGYVPKVSVGMPVYNGSRYLAGAIQSLLSQTFTDFELIISDNASTDDTERICREFAARDPRVRYDRLTENRGAVDNFNRLVRLSQGRYFKWAAADDLCDPQFLEVLVAILDAHPQVVWCHSVTGKIDGEGRVLNADDPESEGLATTRQAGLPRQDHNSHFPYRRYRGVLLGTAWCADCYGLIRTDKLEATGLLAACYGSEKVLIGQLALSGQYREHPETLFWHRVHPAASGNLASSQGQQKFIVGGLHKRWRLPSRIELLLQHVRAVTQASLPVMTKVYCYSTIVEYIFQVHKWWHVAMSFVGRKPLKGYLRKKPTTNYTDVAQPNSKQISATQSEREVSSN